MTKLSTGSILVLALACTFNTTFAQFSSGYSFSTRICNGAAYISGSNSYGQSGNGSSGGNSSTPTAVASLNSGVTQLSGGGSHCLALKADGTVWAWG